MLNDCTHTDMFIYLNYSKNIVSQFWTGIGCQTHSVVECTFTLTTILCHLLFLCVISIIILFSPIFCLATNYVIKLGTFGFVPSLLVIESITIETYLPNKYGKSE